MKFPLLSSALIALVAATAAPAAAGVHPARNDPDALETIVRFSDLDLNRAAGAEQMLVRLERAAGDVCGEAPSPREVGKRSRYRACVATTLDRAVASIDAPLLTARYTGKTSARMAANN